MPPTAAPPRSKLDDAALEEELASQKGSVAEDDGLGGDPPAKEAPPSEEVSKEDFEDPNSEFNSGVPGGRQPGDDGYVEPEGGAEPPPAEQPPAPPTPPANLPEGEGEPDEENTENAKPKDEPLGIIGDRELGLKVGGRKPDSATLHLKGGKIEMRGPKGSQFDRGDRFLTVSTLQITGDNDQDTIVKDTGDVTSTSKKQNATLCGIARLEDWVGDRLEGKGLKPKEIEMIWDALELDPEA